MNFLKRGAITALSSILALSSLTSLSSLTFVNAENISVNNLTFSGDTEISSSDIIVVDDMSDLTIKQKSSSTETTTATDTPVVATTEPTIEDVTTVDASACTIDTDTEADSNFNVFEIYDAHIQYLASTTTTTPTTTSTTTTTTTPQIYYSQKEALFGIDVSKWQGEIDWQKVKEAGVDFAIIRAGYGNLASQEDPMFDINIQAAQAVGIPCGVYWYSYADSPEDAKKEAEVCYSVIKDYKFEYPVFFDIEEDFQRDNLSTATVSAIVDSFCSTLEDKGYYVGVYSCASFLNTKIYASVLDKYDVWVAHYNTTSPAISRSYGMWQYSKTGSVNGISGYVDTNYGYTNYPYLIASNNKNGF